MSTESGRYHVVGVVPEACCADVNTHHSSGSFAALYSHTAGWNRDRDSARTVGSPSYEKPQHVLGSWTVTADSSCRGARRQVTVTSQQRALLRLRVALLGSLRKLSRDTRTCPPLASRFLMSTVTQQSVPIALATDQSGNPCLPPLRQTCARFNRICLVCCARENSLECGGEIGGNVSGKTR